MTDNGNQPRPVRTLTVKNFSVIKEATLEFGKITVLIGPQSSGKSLLCRLAFFFQQVLLDQAEEAIKASEDIESFLQRVKTLFNLWFEANTPPNLGAEISYSDGQYRIWLERKQIDEGILERRFEISDDVRNSYESVWRALDSEKQRRESLPNPKYFGQQVRERLLKLRTSESPEVYSFIPSTRSFFLTIHQAILGMARRFDDISLRFSQDFSYGFENRIPKSGLDHSLTSWINSESERILSGKVVPSGADFHFRSNDGRTLMLDVLSSGTQELLPLLTLLREYVAASAAVAKVLNLPHALHKRLFFLEEPESNVFPTTQYDLVRIFARMANEPVLDAYWVITTHSPYILSSFNNLIEAAQVAEVKPELKVEITKLIPEQYWVKSIDFKAYCIHDGNLESIMDAETGLISGNYLDSVSDTIGSEFDELLRLGYVKA